MTELSEPRRRTGRRIGIAAAAVIVVAGLIVAGVIVMQRAETKPAAPPALSTVRVTTGSMVSETKASGTVQYADKEPVVSGLAGVVTDLPPAGTTIAAGEALYRVDTRPVIMLSGPIPAWRDFAPGMTDGEDVRQLEQNLLAFGFFSDEPDTRFGTSTATAVRAWQKFIGVVQTGTVEHMDIVFSDQELRVDSLDSRVGAQVALGGPLLQATSVRQVIELNLRSTDRALATVGATVTVTLPSGTGTEGVVESVGSAVGKPDADGQGSSVIVPVRVSVADQAALAGLALAGVTVSFASTVKNDVLTVPVDALVPISENDFAVELPRTTSSTKRTLVPVTVGAFASGMVEISGDGIVDGLSVVVPTR